MQTDATEKLKRLKSRRSTRGSGARSERRTNPMIRMTDASRLTWTLREENPPLLPTSDRP